MATDILFGKKQSNEILMIFFNGSAVHLYLSIIMYQQM
jgi:hypothetical protein